MTQKVNHIAPQGHPIWILMEEHAKVLSFANKLADIAEVLFDNPSRENLEGKLPEINTIASHFKDSIKHYDREENVLFPYIEKHGITGPPKVMWMEHNQIRDTEKKLYALIENNGDVELSEFAEKFNSLASSLEALLRTHFDKENNVLFNAAMQHLSESEFTSVGKEFDEIGYCQFTPTEKKSENESDMDTTSQTTGNSIAFDTGDVTKEQLESLLNTLPVEITFIDDKDTVRYFSKPKDMIFTRTKAIIGRKVQMCHPEKSVHLVNKIVEEFRNGTKDVAEFLIKMGEKYVYIRYFPVRNPEGKYLGCMEVTQDIAPLQELSGERRLLDWE